MEDNQFITDVADGSANRHFRKFTAPAEDSQVKIARSRFRSVLKHMVQENCMQDEESDSDTEENTLYKYKMSRAGSGLSMPPHKRSKSGNGDQGKAKVQPAFVMKLFDRGVDLAQFTNSTPLYPICRAWIQNKPHAIRQKRDVDSEMDFEPDEMEYSEDTGEVYHLPPPEPLPFDEYGLQISYRIPAPLPIRNETDEPFDINYDDSAAPSPAILFQNHLDRWNLVRHRWREASVYNESRFGGSFGLLRQIYERNRPEDQSTVVASAKETGFSRK